MGASTAGEGESPRWLKKSDRREERVESKCTRRCWWCVEEQEAP